MDRRTSLDPHWAETVHRLKQKLMAISTTAEDLHSRIEEDIDCPPAQVQTMMVEILDAVEQMSAILDEPRTRA